MPESAVIACRFTSATLPFTSTGTVSASATIKTRISVSAPRLSTKAVSAGVHARTIENLSFSLDRAVQEGTDLKTIPGVGKAISDKIRELLSTGEVSTHQKLLAELPEGVLDLMAIPGIGPKSAMLFAQELGVNTVEGLEAAVNDGSFHPFKSDASQQ